MEHKLLINREVFTTDDTDFWVANANHPVRVAESRTGGVNISTVFIGVGGALFETMIFGGTRDGSQWRANTYDEAEATHASILKAERAAHRARKRAEKQQRCKLV